MSYGFHEIFRRIVIKWRTCMVKVLLHNAHGSLPPKLGRDALHFYLCHQNWAVTRYTSTSATKIGPWRATLLPLPPKLGRDALHCNLPPKFGCAAPQSQPGHCKCAVPRYIPISATKIGPWSATLLSLPPKLGRDALHSFLGHRNLAVLRHSPIWATETAPCRATLPSPFDTFHPSAAY